jgi:excisionase family DNA binding protein
MMADESYITIDEVAKHYKVSVSTVRSWIRSGAIPQDSYLRAGKTFRFLLSEFDAALRASQNAKQGTKKPETTNTDDDI